MNYFQRLLYLIYLCLQTQKYRKEIIMGCQQSLTETPHSSAQLDIEIKPDGLLIKQCESAQNVVFPKNKFTMTDQHRKFIFQCCKSYSFFSDLPDQKLKELSMKFVMSLSSEQWLFKEGSIAGFFFIIAEGYVDVIKKGHFLRKLGPGDCFGEMALLYGIKRSSSIRTVKEFRMKNYYFVLNRNDFLETTQYYNESKNSQFLNLVSTHPLFTYFTSREKFQLAQSSIKISFKKGERILSKYDEPYCFFVIKNGGIRLSFPNKKFLDISKGNIFGYFGSNTIQCSATSTEETVTYAIGKDQVNKILLRNIKYLYLWNKVRYVLINCSRIQSISLKRIQEITALFTFKFVKKQEPICLCHSSIKKIIIPLTCTENAELIGQQLFIGKNKYSFDLIAEKSGYFGEIDSSLFMRLVEDEKLTIENQFLEGFNLSNSQTVAVFSNENKALFLCKEKRFNMNYMIERVSQKDQNLIQELKIKAQILNIANCRLIQGLYFFGLRDNEYFLVKQFIRGSTIRENMLKIGVIPYSISRFYISCIVMIIQCLHSKGIACQRLSINDFKIDETGYLCINEFQGIILSGEKKQKKQINKNIIQDFKRVGLISYELLIGIPLYNYQSKEINVNIQQLNFPINFKSKQAKELIQALLFFQNSTENRWQKIKSLKFFKGIEWKGLLKKQLEAPVMSALMNCNPLLV